MTTVTTVLTFTGAATGDWPEAAMAAALGTPTEQVVSAEPAAAGRTEVSAARRRDPVDPPPDPAPDPIPDPTPDPTPDPASDPTPAPDPTPVTGWLDPRVHGCVGLVSVAGPAGAVLVIRWDDDAAPDPAFVDWWTAAAGRHGLEPGTAEVGPDASAADYGVVPGEPKGVASFKGSPCVIRKR